MPKIPKVEEYLKNNDLHQFCLDWQEQDVGEPLRLDDADSWTDAFKMIDRNLTFQVESKFEDCLRSKTPKNSTQAVISSGRALGLNELNRAIATCEYANGLDEPGEELIACMMNRIEFRLKHEVKTLDYADLLRDLDMAIEHTVKKAGTAQPRQLYIKAFCLAKLGRLDEARQRLTESEEVFSRLENASPIEKVMFTNNRNKVAALLKNSSTVAVGEEECLPFPTNPGVEVCPDNPAFSAAVRIQTAADGSKKVLAVRRITTGEVIGVETAESSALNYLTASSGFVHCNHCLVKTSQPFPCPTCSDVVFCSIDCLHSALNSYHPFECSMALVFFLTYWSDDPALKLTLPAIRAVFQKQVSHFQEGLDKNDVYEASLSGLRDKLNRNDYVHRYFLTLTVACLRLVRLSGYLDAVKPNDMSQIETAICMFLFKRIVTLWFRGDSILEPDAAFQCRGAELDLVQVGLGYFPNIDLVRHGCAQNALRIFKGNRQVIAAARNIAEGEEITINRMRNLNKRKVSRGEYLANSTGVNGECDCMACSENWPFEIDLIEGFKDHEFLKKYMLLDQKELTSTRGPMTWLRFVMAKSELLENGLEDERLYYLHAATNVELLRVLQFVYGLVKMD